MRNPTQALQYLKKEDVEVVMLDVTSAESVSKLWGQLKDRLLDGKLDVLVNNAGSGATGP